MSRAREGVIYWGRLTLSGTFYPYQVAFGFSLRYWPCIFTPSIRIHMGPFKVFLALSLKKKAPWGQGDRAEGESNGG